VNAKPTLSGRPRSCWWSQRPGGSGLASASQRAAGTGQGGAPRIQHCRSAPACGRLDRHQRKLPTPGAQSNLRCGIEGVVQEQAEGIDRRGCRICCWWNLPGTCCRSKAGSAGHRSAASSLLPATTALDGCRSPETTGNHAGGFQNNSLLWWRFLSLSRMTILAFKLRHRPEVQIEGSMCGYLSCRTVRYVWSAIPIAGLPENVGGVALPG